MPRRTLSCLLALTMLITLPLYAQNNSSEDDPAAAARSKRVRELLGWGQKRAEQVKRQREEQAKAEQALTQAEIEKQNFERYLDEFNRKARAANREPVSDRRIAARIPGPDGRPVQAQIRVLDWPRTKRPSLEANLSEEQYDGFDMLFLYLRNEDLRMRMQAPPGWTSVEFREDRSQELRHRTWPNAAVRFYQFSKYEFFPNTSVEYRIGYMEGLKARLGEAMDIVNEVEFISSSPYSSIERFPAFMLEFRVSTKNEAVVRVRDYVCFIDDQLLITRIQGLEEEFDEFVDDVESAVLNAEVLSSSAS